MSTNLFSLYNRFEHEGSVIRFLQQKRVLCQQRLCAKEHPMTLSSESRSHPPRWRCHKAECRTDVPLRRGTIFEGSNTDFRKVIMFIYLWSNDFEASKFCSKEFGTNVAPSVGANNSSADLIELDKKCAVAWRKRLPDVAAESVLSHPCVIGDPGHIVEVDGTLFSKRKSHRGREPGTTVISDCWGGYRRLSREDYTHLRMNHSINFLHPDDPEVHTQSVESLWAQVKRRNKARCGTRRSERESYFCEFMWRRRKTGCLLTGFGIFIIDLGFTALARFAVCL
ncbi:hypothetical protein M513_11742 [Trichuris suis]|uniref:ISXO2-like transposase domain-containing protein n=1 Tax=Trichuris suis TaxID=68888 RepID=A0A085LQY3_9BILA|nr:hypothetical protein M513_11742 [Trichuris suis]